MTRPDPREFRDDVVRVARNRDDGVTIERTATDFGVHPMTLRTWMRQADIDEGAKPGEGTGESAELRDAIVTWIERTYHRCRRQAGLGRLAPIEFEAIMTTPASQAA